MLLKLKEGHHEIWGQYISLETTENKTETIVKAIQNPINYFRICLNTFTIITKVHQEYVIKPKAHQLFNCFIYVTLRQRSNV
jgi:hypothetical protein